jgi:NADPH-dependent 2,4-dienoyl-CoA reductase/sulfur reductase-like enzyme
VRRYDAVADLDETCDLLVVGAGPAGLAGAAEAAALGLSVLLVDENPGPGGQIYRGVGATPVAEAVLGRDYRRGATLAAGLEASDAAYLPGATLWTLAPVPADGEGPAGFEVGLSRGGRARLVRAREVVAATGALERPFPIPGWTLPGVMTAGAAQIALKTAGLVPGGPTVVAGCGPLLDLLTAQLRRAGARITAILDTAPRANWAAAAPHALDFLRSPYLAKGLGLLAGARRGVRVVGGVTALAARGEGKVAEVVFRRGGGPEERIACDLLLLHQGVVPNMGLPAAAGCAQHWDEGQLCWRPTLDAWLQTSVPGLSVAGDGAGIAGAEAAAPRGRLAALAAACRLGRLGEAERDARAAPVRAQLARAERGRRFIDALHRPAEVFRVPSDPETIVCRCEEVTAGQLRAAVAHGVTGPNQAKAFLRAGMGPCQGRLCGLTVTELIAQARGVAPAEVGAYRQRPPIKPVTLGEIASLPKTEAARRAVER